MGGAPATRSGRVSTSSSKPFMTGTGLPLVISVVCDPAPVSIRARMRTFPAQTHCVRTGQRLSSMTASGVTFGPFT